jgi:2-polyprenyl-3-methyl-5-hydroxy-6-metoxy-1,4-benzoquinol methylase
MHYECLTADLIPAFQILLKYFNQHQVELFEAKELLFMKDNRNHKSVIEIITEIEATFDVNSLIYKSVHVWPWIRLAIWTQLNNPHINYSSTKASALDYTLDNQIINQINDLKIDENPDLTFFSRFEDYTDKSNGKFYNRHIDPIIDLIKKELSFIKIELLNPETEKTNPRFENTTFLQNPIKTLFSEGNNTSSISNFKSFAHHVEKISKRIVLNEFVFIEQANLLKCYSRYFEKLFQAIGPKAVFFVCYYYIIPMAIINACKKLGIVSVDIQHGKQGKYHGMYSYWTNIPSHGYELLPDYFWCWGNESKINIEKSRRNSIDSHVAIVGGNRWLATWLEGRADGFEKDIAEDFHATLNNKEKKILVSLQPFDEKIPLPEHVIETMRHSPINWLWLLRLHPLRRQDEGRLSELLTQKGIQNFEIHHSTVLPLYSLLKIADHHITYYSSVCYEALVFGVPTTIVDPSGFTLYEDYIKKGIFSYADTTSDLISCIKETKDMKQLREETPYIETSKNVAKEAFNMIVNKHNQLKADLKSNQKDKLNDTKSLNRLGKKRFQNNDIEGAIDALNESIQKDPYFADSHNDLGFIYWQIGEAEKSRHHFEKVLDIEPNNRNAVINYSLILADSNKLDAAQELLSQFLKQNPKDKKILDLIDQIQNKIESESNTVKTTYEKLWDEKLNDPVWLKNDGKGRVEYCVKLLQANFKFNGNTKLLDVGCGRGTLGYHLDSQITVYGIDISEKAVSEAKKVYNRADAIDLDHEALPYDDGFFDIAIALDVIEHVYDPLSMLHKIYRSLNGDGQLILSTPNILYEKYLKDFVRTRKFPKTSCDSFPYDGGHIHFFTYRDIFDLMQVAGFSAKPIGPFKNKIDYEFKESTVWILGEKRL